MDVQRQILTSESFTLMRIGDGFELPDYVKITPSGPRSLEHIIKAQLDEPRQKRCIYRLCGSPQQSMSTSTTKMEPCEKFVQITVKTTNYLDKSAVAVYFLDVTNHV